MAELIQRKRIVIAGGSGFLGTSLAERLCAQEYDVVVLTRGTPKAHGRVRYVHWDARTAGPWIECLDGAFALVNFVGRSVDCRKTAENKRAILESRVDSVRALAAGFRNVSIAPETWIQTSTAHIFGDTGDELLDESSPIGVGFAPEVGQAWEKAYYDSNIPSCRRVVLRISFVLGRNGGALRTLARLARWFLGGHTGTGNQFMSWIHETDLNAVILRALDPREMSGMYVITAPNPVTNRQFMRKLRGAVHRPWSPPVPTALVRLGSRLLRTDPELALYGRRCIPTRLLAEGFRFTFPTLRDALDDLLVRRR